VLVDCSQLCNAPVSLDRSELARAPEVADPIHPPRLLRPSNEGRGQRTRRQSEEEGAPVPHYLLHFVGSE